jgi:hypothetical protein
MIGFLRVAKPFPNLPARSLTLVTRPYFAFTQPFLPLMHLFSIPLFAPSLTCIGLRPPAAISITHTLMLNTYAVCTQRKPLTRYHRENKQTNEIEHSLSSTQRWLEYV